MNTDERKVADLARRYCRLQHSGADTASKRLNETVLTGELAELAAGIPDHEPACPVCGKGGEMAMKGVSYERRM